MEGTTRETDPLVVVSMKVRASWRDRLDAEAAAAGTTRGALMKGRINGSGVHSAQSSHDGPCSRCEHLTDRQVAQRTAETNALADTWEEGCYAGIADTPPSLNPYRRTR